MGETLDFLIWLLVAVLLLLALAASVITVRRFLLERGGGTIECGLRWLSGSGTSDYGDTGSGRAGSVGTAPSGSAWRPGVAAYHRDELFWFGALGILLRPTLKLPRRSLTVVSRRLPTPSEAAVLGDGRVVVEVRTGASVEAVFEPETDSDSGSGSPGTIELAMTSGALTGFLAWLEASPPSSHLRDIA